MSHLHDQWREAVAPRATAERITPGPAWYHRGGQVIPVVVVSGKVEPFPLMRPPYALRLVLVTFVDQIPPVDRSIEVGKPMSPSRWVDPQMIEPG